ncbi:MAG: sn-glycerol-3-phosphate ABC transporter ATP-binding protein UgpC [SAR324 cluster bacterium]|nr:sn-glycerol-3-phosphate ABC transporter ATP-binding protein UgpC [SAR324 cluster bacterium]
MAEVKLRNVVKKYGKTEVVHSINLDIGDCEFIVFVGPSGCGKSTTLRMIAGLEEISGGEISISGKVVNNLAPKDRDIAMVFQNYALYPHMNVYKNMSFGLTISKIPKAEIEKRVNEAAKILDIEEFLQRKPSELSGGQRQRVAMGRAIVRKPSIFLFDEPLSNLDAKLRTQMRLEIKQLHKRIQSTIIYVTHDQVEAMTLGDRIVVLKDGYIEQVGDPLDLFHHPANTFVAGFIGTPPMNLVECKVSQAEGGSFLELKSGVKFPIPQKNNIRFADGQKVVMGLRTEDIVPDEGNSQFVEDWKYEGTVEVTEPLGSETNIHMDLAGDKFLAQCDGRIKVKTGDKLKLCFNLNHLHIFDGQSTKSIY